MPIDFSYLDGAAPQEKNTPTNPDTATVTIRVDADSIMLCDGEYMDQPFKAGVLTKIQLPIGQHLLEFLYTEDPDIKVEKEVDFPEAGKSYLVIIKGLKDLVDAAAEEVKRKAEEEARVKAKAEAKRKAEEEARKKAEEEAKRKVAEEAEAKRKARAEAKSEAQCIAEQDRNNMYDLVLLHVSAWGVMRVLRVLRENIGIPFKGADLVNTPCVIKKSISKSEAETFKRQLEEAGAEVEIR